jgi:hypothetical protein
MAHLSLGLSQRRWAPILFGAGALTIGACSSLSTGPWFAAPASSTDASHARASQPYATFTISLLNTSYPGYEVTAINDENYIAGVYKTNSFTAPCTLQQGAPDWVDCSKAVPSTVAYPGAASTYFNANDNTDKYSYDAGYVINPPLTAGVTCTICGVLYDTENQQFLKLLEDPEEASSGGCAVTELLGINNAKIAVGFYETGISPNCRKHAFEEYLFNGNQKFVDFNVCAACDSVASGIDNGGDVVGTESGSSGNMAWYYIDGKYTPFAAPYSSSTQPAGINWDHGIVGSYTTSSGSVTHGFLIFTNPDHQIQNPLFQTIDLGTKKLTDINGVTSSYLRISGWYQSDAAGDVQGFVGSCTTGCAPASAPQRKSDFTSRARAEPRVGPTRPAGLRP